MPMLSVAPSLLLRMYVGETPRLTKALFTLAAKLQPCLIFIDEADSLFCARSGSDHAVDRKIVTECKLWFSLRCFGPLSVVQRGHVELIQLHN
jgi:ATP-dependent 26S proteasome regulatory subunit